MTVFERVRAAIAVSRPCLSFSTLVRVTWATQLLPEGPLQASVTLTLPLAALAAPTLRSFAAAAGGGA